MKQGSEWESDFEEPQNICFLFTLKLILTWLTCFNIFGILCLYELIKIGNRLKLKQLHTFLSLITCIFFLPSCLYNKQPLPPRACLFFNVTSCAADPEPCSNLSTNVSFRCFSFLRSCTLYSLCRLEITMLVICSPTHECPLVCNTAVDIMSC